MFDPVTIGIGTAVWLLFRNQGNTQFGVLTTEREEVYRNALEFLQDPLKLETLATQFQQEGLKVQAAMLRKRAEWRGRTDLVKKQHEHIFAQAMKSENIHGILGVAEAFEKMTATVKASQLRAHAKALYDLNELKANAPKSEPETVAAPAEPTVSEVKVKSNGKSNGKSEESIPRNTEAEVPPEAAVS